MNTPVSPLREAAAPQVQPVGKLRLLVRVLADKVFPAFFWGIPATGAVIDLVRYFRQTPWLDILMRTTALTFTLLFTLLFLFRHDRLGRRARWWERVIALVGTFLPVFLVTGLIAKAPRLALPDWLRMGFLAMSWLGMVWSILSLAYLGRCFGLFPEPRGLVTRGPYRWIRHPLYLGEIVLTVGIACGIATLPAVATLAAYIAFQLWRAKNEERALRAIFPEYRQHMQRTWLILPGIW